MRKIILSLAFLIGGFASASAQIYASPAGPGPIPCAYTTCTVQSLTALLAPGASASALTLSGAPNTGSSTTSFPLLYLNTSGASAPTSFSTGGTYIGINTASGYTGNAIDLHNNGGSSVFSVSGAGVVVMANNSIVSGLFLATEVSALSTGIGFNDTSYSQTSASALPMLNYSGTLNTSGVVPGVFKMAITDTAHGSGTLIMNVLGGASAATTLFSVDTSGNGVFGGALTAGNITAGGSSFFQFNGKGAITSPGADIIQIGFVDGAAPPGQTLQAQSVAAGNGNTSAGNFTIAGGKSNGSGTGSLIFQTTAASASSGVQNSLVTALTLAGGTQGVQFNGSVYTTGGCSALAVTITTGVVTCTASDSNLKNFSGTLDPNEALAFAINMPSRFYTFKNPNNMYSDGAKHIGFSAQDVERLAPHIASAMVRKMAPTPLTPRGTLGLDYSETGPIALAAIKAQEKEFAALKAANDNDVALIHILDRRLSKLERHRR